jgi:hypothetical protein
METHAHELHKAPGHGWKHYLFEFFMLFLAVFCGFLAENWREHIVEHEREKQYMQSLIADLSSDTAALNFGFPRKDDRVKAIDSVFLFFETHHDPSNVPGYVMRNMKRALWDRTYRRNTVTIDQLKNAGGMRLIRKKAISDSIAAYDQHWERLEYYRETYFTHQQIGSAFTEKIINAYDVLPAYRKGSSGNTFGDISDSAVIRINTTSLNEFLNFLRRQKSFTIQDKNNYQSLEEQAVRLLDFIKKEYPAE